MNIQTLEQLIVENKYGRHNIRQKVEADLLDSPVLTKIMLTAVQLLKEYVGKDYSYESKNKRVAILRDMDDDYLKDIFLEIAIIVMSCTTTQTIQSVVGQLTAAMGNGEDHANIVTSSELLAVVCHSDFYDIIPARDSETGSMLVKPNYSLEESTLQYILNTKYLPPMLCRPMEITNNSECGYLTKDSSVILGSGNHHEGEQSLDVINIANGIALSLDPYIVAMEEQPSKKLNSEEAKENFRRMANSSRIVYDDLMNQGNCFYLDHKNDKRGRFYSQGYHVNQQSTSYKKALINLNTKHVITGS